MQRSKIFLMFLCLLSYSLGQNSFAQQQSEQITISTYFPSPFGVYRNLQLYPTRESACNSNFRGDMYYDDTDNNAYFCDGNNWRLLIPAPSGEFTADTGKGVCRPCNKVTNLGAEWSYCGLTKIETYMHDEWKETVYGSDRPRCRVYQDNAGWHLQAYYYDDGNNANADKYTICSARCF